MNLLALAILLAIIAPDFGSKTGSTTLWRSANAWQHCSDAAPVSAKDLCGAAALAMLAKGTTVELNGDRESLCYGKQIGFVRVVVTSGASRGAVGCLLSSAVQE